MSDLNNAAEAAKRLASDFKAFLLVADEITKLRDLGQARLDHENATAAAKEELERVKALVALEGEALAVARKNRKSAKGEADKILLKAAEEARIARDGVVEVVEQAVAEAGRIVASARTEANEAAQQAARDVADLEARKAVVQGEIARLEAALAEMRSRLGV